MHDGKSGSHSKKQNNISEEPMKGINSKDGCHVTDPVCDLFISAKKKKKRRKNKPLRCLCVFVPGRFFIITISR